MADFKRTITPFLLAAGLALLAGCGGGGGGGGGVFLPSSHGNGGGNPPPPPPTSTPTLGTVITNPTVSYTTAWAQTVPLTNGETPAVFPGQANKWDLGQDFGLNDGGDGQFNYALVMEVYTANTGSELFPLDQYYDELSFLTPLMGTAQGVRTAAVSDGHDLNMIPITGTYSAYLNATSDSRLSQSLALSRTPTGSITASWNDEVNLCDEGLLNISGYTPSYQVVLRDSGGTLLETLYSVSGAAADSTTTHTADLTAYAGQTVVLSFEQKSMQETYRDCYTIIDDVSVADDAATEYASNGAFENGDLTSWSTNTPLESQNMMSGVRTVAGLEVQRSFYTVPNKLWGRWVDLFTNNTGSAVTATVHYQTDLGSLGYGIIYEPAGLAGKALSTWDGGFFTRDTGLVFGNAATLNYLSDDGWGNGNGSEFIDVTYSLTIPAGGKAALVNFVIMDGTDTSDLSSTTDATARATDIDAAATAIVNNFWTDTQYRDGMTQEQIDAIKNF